MMSLKYRIVLTMTAATLLSQSGQAHDLEIDLLLGADSNPNELQESYQYINTAVAYGESRIELSHTPVRTGFYYQLEAESSLYQDDPGAISNPKYAEKTRTHADLGFKWRPRMKYGRARYKFEMNYSSRDTTFVDNSTGNIAVFNGEEIGDRFDAAWSGVSISGDLPISEEADFVFDLDAKDKQYESYETLGLSNLDYLQYDLEMGFKKWIWPRTELVTLINAGVRQFVDKRTRDDQGAIVANSDLQYTLLGVDNSLEYNFTDRWKWRLGFKIDQRKDNEDGYYDTTEGEVFTRVQYRNGNYVKFVFSAAYVNRRYDNIDQVLNITEEEMKDKEGYRIKGEFVRNMYEWTRVPFDLIFGFKAESYQNSNPDFTYDRDTAYFGVRWRPLDLLRK